MPFEANNVFNSTMMASFLLVIVNKKNKQTEKNLYFIAISHKFTLKKTPPSKSVFVMYLAKQRSGVTSLS